jgi:GNAT superfamily N-acetyltransferase
MSYTFRRLEIRDLGVLHQVHRALLSALPHPHVFRADTIEHFERNLVGNGVTFGAFFEDRLVAYSAIEFGGPSAAQIKEAFPAALLPAPARLAVHDGSGVLPAHRGHGLQSALNALRLYEARRRRYGHVVGTVSPGNPFSLRNHLRCGFEVRGYAEMYGGMPRWLIGLEFPGPARCLGARS